MTSWYSQQSVGRSQHRPQIPTRNNAQTNRSSDAVPLSYSNRFTTSSNGNFSAPSNIDYSNDAPPEMSQLSMSQLSEASSYSSKPSFHNTIVENARSNSNARGSSQRSSSQRCEPYLHTAMTPTNRAPVRGSTQGKLLQERSHASNSFYRHGRPAAAARVGFLANGTTKRNPYLTKANPYAKSFGSRPTAPQAVSHRSSSSHSSWMHTRVPTAAANTGPSVARKHGTSKQPMGHNMPAAPQRAQERASSITSGSTYHSVNSASAPSTHSRSAISCNFEMELMQKAEAEIKKKIESSLKEKIMPLVADLEEKQSGFYRLVSKSENHCHELLTCIETKASNLQDRATDHIADLEAKFNDKATALVAKVGGELESKTTRARAVGAELDRKVGVAGKMVGTVKLQMEEANENVAANLEELNESVKKAKYTYKKLVKAAAKTVETSTIAIQAAAAKGVASINEASTSFMSSVQEDVVAFAKKSVQGVLGRNKPFSTSSTPPSSTRPRQFISPPSQRPLKEVSNNSGSDSSHTTLGGISENTSPPIHVRTKPRSIKRKISSMKENIAAPSRTANKKARYPSSPSETLASIATPSIIETKKPRSALKLTRSKPTQHAKKARHPSRKSFDFGWSVNGRGRN